MKEVQKGVVESWQGIGTETTILWPMFVFVLFPDVTFLWLSSFNIWEQSLRATPMLDIMSLLLSLLGSDVGGCICLGLGLGLCIHVSVSLSVSVCVSVWVWVWVCVYMCLRLGLGLCVCLSVSGSVSGSLCVNTCVVGEKNMCVREVCLKILTGIRLI